MPEERQALEALREERNKDQECEWEDAGNITFEDVLNGTEQLEGVVPCSPIHPTTAVTFGALEFFRIARLRSPHFSIQAFVKTLCDLQGRYLCRQFTIAFDLYLQIRARVDSIVSQVLQRDSEDWRLKHACAACTYKLTGEPELKFKLLYAMDGNDSLKRVLRRLPDEIEDGHLPLSRDLPTGQVLTSSRYLSREYVNKFDVTGNTDPFSDEDSDANPCAGRWKNMDDAKTRKAWGVYDETGIFIAVCRHGTCLLIVDMVQSGNGNAKYPLAVVSKLMTAFGDGLGGGYDIGCRFQTTLARSTLGSQARVLNHTCLVGAFHGHAHRRLCQLSHLTLYTCERTFSKSNALASTVRYATVFHRQQAINAYFEHNDHFEVYANLTNFLFDNYKQALAIIRDGKTILPNLKRDLPIEDDNIFCRWLEEEKEYLEGLSCEPLEETLHMEYWHRLEVRSEQALRPTVVTQGLRGGTTLRRHAQENYDRDLLLVQDLERKLSISRRWVPEDKEWQDAGRLVANREYRRALDNLESLVVARLFELTKMNRAGTGYKLRKHIAKALQTRSTAIKVALDRYNNRLRLLRDTREDISQRPWAHPTARFAIDTYFKINIHPALAHQLVSQRRSPQFQCSHLKRLHDIAILPGFSGTLHPGESALKGPGESNIEPNIRLYSTSPHLNPYMGTLTKTWKKKKIIEHEVEEASHTLQDVLEVSFDQSDARFYYHVYDNTP
ncbi:hypothetical protein BKA83DRAFT_4465278 [Pisolithus microcarpus]|nr:hypothetical protein BKA83DRAFT_4465278 [Pisolithus microcarpus]